MNVQKVNIVNKSLSSGIFVHLKSPENADLPQVEDAFLVEANSSLNTAYQNATANMFVWLDIPQNIHKLVWKGIVPTKVQNSIEIYPEEKKVMFGDVELPSNFQPTTSFPQKKEVQGSKSFFSYILIALVIIIIIIGLLLLSGKIKIKK